MFLKSLLNNNEKMGKCFLYKNNYFFFILIAELTCAINGFHCMLRSIIPNSTSCIIFSHRFNRFMEPRLFPCCMRGLHNGSYLFASTMACRRQVSGTDRSHRVLLSRSIFLSSGQGSIQARLLTAGLQTRLVLALLKVQGLQILRLPR